MTDWLALTNEFHFLRPVFLLLIPMAILVFLLTRKQQTANNWTSVIDKSLLSHLSIGQIAKENRSFLPWLLTIIIAITSIALAGPAYEKKSQQVIKNQDALILVLDLSLSMYGEDEKPSRIIKAKRKLSDILRARNDGLTALVVYSGSANTVTPLTDDTATIESMLQALEPNIMPKYGSNAKLAFEHSLQLMKNAAISKSRILWLTDEMSVSQLSDIAKQLNNIQLRIITFGTESGAPIPLKNGFLKDNTNNTVIAKLNYSQMQDVSANSAIELFHNRIDDADFNDFINPEFIENSDKNTEQQFDVYIDRGFYLALILLPLLLLGFRRGSGLLLILMVIQPDTAYSFDLIDYFKNDNQKAQAAFNKGEFEQAANQFEDQKWLASSQYKKGDYEKALQTYEKFDDAESLYNQANSLAKMGKFDQALERYNAALHKQKEFPDAQHNKSLIEELLKQQEQEQKKNSDQPQSDQENSEQNSESSEQQSEQSDNSQQQNSEQSSEQSSESQQEKQHNAQDKNQSEQKQQQAESDQQENEQNDQTANQKAKQGENSEQQSTQEQMQQASSADNEMTPQEKQQQQALQQWLRKIPDQPGEYLKNKFGHQYEQNKRNNNLVDQESEQLW